MDVTEFKELIEKEKNINVEENKMNNQDNQKVGMKNQILESLNGLTVSERTVSFDEKTNKKMWNSYSNRETVNIIVAGKTGVGKSSLINYIFGEKVAEVGAGAPVTQEIGAYHLKEDNINLYDTKGIEAENYEETLSNIQNFLAERQKSKDENEHIHIAWLCISERSDRIEAADIKLLEILKSSGIPTIAVFTKRDTVKESEFVKKVKEEGTLEKARAIVRVRSVEELVEIDEDEKVV